MRFVGRWQTRTRAPKHCKSDPNAVKLSSMTPTMDRNFYLELEARRGVLVVLCLPIVGLFGGRIFKVTFMH